ncbi:restriction endonuclease subunit S [Pseudomonas carnis]|uniref:restriction endonuclease subunit S n=1 Tax=Pseudomonas carnis TaxID=2487355 RepID=UPI001E556A01|nr:restriction endonuclease subunit S [Pseudomonas carnis]
MSELPSGWVATTLGDVANWGSGGTPSRSESSFYGGTIPWIKSGELNSRYVTTTEEHITEAALNNSSAKLFPTGSVAIAMYGATIGKTAILGIDAATNQACAVGAPIEGLIGKEFLYRLLQHEKEAFIEKGKGGAQPNISQAVIKAHAIGLPPLAEQTRIAQKLDELLAQVDTLKVRMDVIPTLLKRFRQSVLAAAVSGQLTEAWRELSPPLSPISINDVKKAWIDVYRLHGRKYKEVNLIPDDLGRPLPNSWVEARVGEVFDVYVGATPSRGNTTFWGGPIPWVSSSEVAFCRIKKTKESITEVGYKSTSTTIHPVGTVMLAMIGQGKTRGQPAILDIEACHNQNTAAIRVHSDYCIPEYLYYYLYERYEETRRVGAGNNQQALSKKTVQSLPFALPPLAEQTEIVRCVEQLFTFADQLEAKVTSAKNCIDHLTQSILAKAFRGELLPQDPKDEPASVLLERIKAQRTSAPTVKRDGKAQDTPKTKGVIGR